VRLIDLTGKRFGRLVVIRRYGTVKHGASNTPSWLVKCDCGNEKTVMGCDLRKNHGTRSCGCGRGGKPTHGMSSTIEHRIWRDILKRCYNKNNHAYKYYGQRGIRVCDEWIKNFKAFYDDMGPRPSPKHSIDRIDNDGDYEPSNCRWVTWKEQNRNKRNIPKHKAFGKSLSVSEWSEVTGISTSAISQRLNRLGWSIEDAVSKPVQVHKR
jgi:hypothetical protein